MDSNNEKLCSNELDHFMLDGDKKINLEYISDTWSAPFKVSEAILQKWLDNYKGGRKVAKEFLIRGTDTENNAVITLVPESKLAKIDELCPNAARVLYSIKVASLNGKSLNLPETTENKFITLKLESKKREIKVNSVEIPPVEKKPESTEKRFEPTKKPTPSIFGTAKPKEEKKPEIKAEKTSPVLPKSSENEKKVAPESKNSKKNQSIATSNQVKSFANFFGSKPSTSATADKKATEKKVVEATTKIETIEIKDEPERNRKSSEKSSGKSLKNQHKRNFSKAIDLNEEQTKNTKESGRDMPSKKKIKLEPKSAKSRLMQICDSSSDEEETQQKESEKSVDEEMPILKEKENETPSPQKNPIAKTNGASTNGSRSSSGKRRTKIKKIVTRTYEDEDGFINTVREMEGVSCSEGEEPEPAVDEPPAKKTAPAASNSTTTERKIPPPVGKKQGSILSFFSKK